MSVNAEPLLTDVFQMIRVKLAANSTVTGIIGTSPLRCYRNNPPGNVSYPTIVMSLLSSFAANEDYVSIDYTIQLAIYSKSDNRSNQDILVRELMGIFSNPGTNYNQDLTKIEKINFSGGGGEIYIEDQRLRILPLTLFVKARRIDTLNA